MTQDALRRLAGFRPHAAVIFGSGLAGLPHGAEVEAELGYGELDWPRTAVPGHANLLRLARVPVAGRDELRLALACGRPHGYEGWSERDLGRAVSDLAACGARRIVLTNSCGALRPGVVPGSIVVCSDVVDLQRPPGNGGVQPDELTVCGREEAVAVASAMASASAKALPGARLADVGVGVYVAVAGPQFETPAEVAWLAGLGAVVGMSAAPELRAAHAGGGACLLLGLVANRAAAVGSHEDVLAVGDALSGALAAALPAALLARWPDITTTQGA